MLFLSNPDDGVNVAFPAEGIAASIQYNDGDMLAGASKIRVKDGDLMLEENATVPLAPLAGSVKLYGRTYGPVGGRTMLATMDPSGMAYTLQPALWRQGVAFWRPPGNATTVPGVLGIAAPTAVGTATARNIATTNALTCTKRLGYVSTATASSVAGHRVATAQYTVGTGGLLGGFFYACQFGVSDASLVAAARTFVGMASSTAAPTNVSPATLTNCIGIGHDAADTNWYIYYGGSVAQTRVSLGANFPINNTDVIQLVMFSPQNANGIVDYFVERISTVGKFVATGYVGPGTPGVALPANTTLLAHRAWRTNNTTLAAVGIDIASMYIETDW